MYLYVRTYLHQTARGVRCMYVMVYLTYRPSGRREIEGNGGAAKMGAAVKH